MIKIEENKLTHKEISKIWNKEHLAWFSDNMVDFSNVENCDSSVVAFLVHWAKQCQNNNKKLSCFNVPNQLLELLQIYKVTSLIEIL